MRWAVATLLMTFAAGWAVLQVAATPSPAISSAVVTTAVGSTTEDSRLPVGTLIGAGTCANSGCHGGSEEFGKPWRSAYTAWINKDPHRRAYAVLFSERSVKIVEELTKHDAAPIQGTPPQQFQAYLIENCTVCHATAQEEVEDYSGQVARDYTFSDGVSCETCHGAAAGWLEPHQHDKAWDGKSDGERSELGFVQHADLQVRADVCVRCHVGSQESDVDHDLIAAGHPRLNFEFYYYMDKYAVLSGHWDVAEDRKRNQDYYAKLWAIGQLTSAKASLDLSEARAGGSTKRVWPEFSEYGCYSCHHELEGSLDSMGRPPWNTWYVSRGSFVAPATQADDGTEIASINEQLAGFAAPLKQQQQSVADLSAKLAAQETLPDAAVNLLFARVKKKPTRNWDEVGQWYLALWAYYDQMGGDANGSLAGLKAKLAELQEWLDSPFGKRDQQRGPIDLLALIDEITNELNTVSP